MANVYDPEHESRARELFEQAYRLQRNGKLTDAIKLYKDSIELYPTAEAHTFLGWALSNAGRYEEAIEECKLAIDLDPEFGNPYNDIGAYLIQMGKYYEAEDWLYKALEAPQYDARHFAHMNLGRVYQRQGKWFEALAEFGQAVKIRPEYKPAYIAAINLQAMMN